MRLRVPIHDHISRRMGKKVQERKLEKRREIVFLIFSIVEKREMVRKACQHQRSKQTRIDLCLKALVSLCVAHPPLHNPLNGLLISCSEYK